VVRSIGVSSVEKVYSPFKGCSNKTNTTDRICGVEKVKEIAREKGCTPGQLALAWVLAQGDNMFPIPGTKQQKYLEENIGAVNVHLSESDLAKLRPIIQKLTETENQRYDPNGMALLNA